MANDTFKALAHPLRRDIVERLSGGVATVGEVTRDFGVSKPTISRHLKMLEEAGVVTRVIDGRTHRLALRPEKLAEASGWLDIQRGAVTVCTDDPGYDVDLAIQADTGQMQRWLVGRVPFRDLIANGHARMLGPSRLARAFPTWFDTTYFAKGLRRAGQHHRGQAVPA